MPTHNDETLHDRYAREHADHMARLAKMTPEQIAEMELSLHNAMAEVDRLRANACQGGEAVAWHTDDHLTDKSATTYDREVAERWRAKGWPVTPLHYTHAASQEPQIVPDYKRKFECLVEHAKRQDRVISELRYDENIRRFYDDGAVWFWAGDETDNLETLACPVVINAGDLRALLNGEVTE